MKIEYKNTFRDIFLFHAVHQFLSSVLQIFLLLFSVAIFFLELNEGNYTQAFFTTLMWYIFLWVIQIIFNAIYAYSKKSKSVLTKHIIEVNDEHLYEETEFNKSFFYWPGVFKAVSCPTAVPQFKNIKRALVGARFFYPMVDQGKAGFSNFFVQIHSASSPA